MQNLVSVAQNPMLRDVKNAKYQTKVVSRSSWAQVCRSGMQQPNAACTRAPPQCRSCPCATCIWLLHPAPILMPKMVLTQCILRWWWFSFHQLAKILHLHSWWSSPAATCAGGVFLGAQVHLLMCKQMNRHLLQLALCSGGGCGLYS